MKKEVDISMLMTGYNQFKALLNEYNGPLVCEGELCEEMIDLMELLSQIPGLVCIAGSPSFGRYRIFNEFGFVSGGIVFICENGAIVEGGYPLNMTINDGIDDKSQPFLVVGMNAWLNKDNGGPNFRAWRRQEGTKYDLFPELLDEYGNVIDQKSVAHSDIYLERTAPFYLTILPKLSFFPELLDELQ